MSPLMLRQLWSLVESTQTTILLSLDDSALVQWLVRRLQDQRSIDHNEAHLCSSYISSRLPLIRDLALSRVRMNLG